MNRLLKNTEKIQIFNFFYFAVESKKFRNALLFLYIPVLVKDDLIIRGI